MITVLSMNPCLDKVLEADALDLNAVNRVQVISRQVGGKGVNDTKMLHSLGREVCLVGLQPEGCGGLIERALCQDKIPCALVDTKGDLRVNHRIRFSGRQDVLEINERGARVSPGTLSAVREVFLDHAAKSAFAVMAGSVPEGTPEEFYAGIGDALREMQVPYAADCDGVQLKNVLRAGPDLIKPNEEEFRELLADLYPDLLPPPGHESAQDYLPALHGLIKRTGVRHICLTLGLKGAVLTNGNESLFCAPPPVEAVSTQGAGDAMLTGVVSVLLRGGDLREALEMGTACSGATVMLAGTVMGEKETVMRLLPRIHATDLN